MIKPKKSGFGNKKRFYAEIQNIAISMNFFRNKFSYIYDESLDLINGIVRNLNALNKKRDNEGIIEKTTKAIINKTDNFELEYNEIKHAGLKIYLPKFSKNVKTIANKLDELSEKEINDIRGLLTEAVACSYLGDVRLQPNLIWDCVFEKNNSVLIKVGNTQSTDIYYKQKNINLCECKTKPYFKTTQFEFMLKVQEEYEKENEEVSLFTFVLQYSVHPTFEDEIKKIPQHFEIKTIENLKLCN